MATAPISNSDVQVVPLRDASLPKLEDLFDEQCAEWLELLRWDYSGPSRLIRETARARELAGFCALAKERLIGFAFFVVEGSRCSIGDMYVTRTWRGLGCDGLMAEAMLDHLGTIPRLRRIESQCVNVGNDAADEVLVSRKFHRYERQYMMRELPVEQPPPCSEAPDSADSEISIRPWSDPDFGKAARVIHRSYRGKHDSRINVQYRTEEGCAELLTILTDHIWCGTFLPHVSRIAVDRGSGNTVGVLVASRLAAGAGHIGQISVLPSYQGKGIGRRMIESVFFELSSLGFGAVSLAVTGANTHAVHLYESCGFRTIHRFPVFYRERR